MARPVSESLKGYARGMVGGLIFSIAPLYTQELWWQGYVIPPSRMLFIAVSMLVVLVAYAHYVGMHGSSSLKENILEAFQVVTLATVTAIIVLKLAGQLPSTISFYEGLTRVVGEGSCVAIGVAVGATQLGEDPDEQEGQQGKEGREKRGHVLHELALAILGAILLAAGLAPTLEIPAIAAAAEPWQVLVVALLAFAIGLVVVNYAKFKGSKRHEECLFAGGKLGDGVVTYAVGLSVAAAMLWSVGSLDAFGPTLYLYQTIFLSVATTLGASVGRMLL